MRSVSFAEADGVRVFYREAGEPSHPTLLLLHGFPSSSHPFRELIPLLADKFHLVAPDLPGFGLTEVPPQRHYHYSFDSLGQTGHFALETHVGLIATRIRDVLGGEQR